MKRGEAVYHFIDKFAYFACAGNIIVECYTMSDGEDVYKRLMTAFDKYMQYYEKLTEAVEQGEITQESADAAVRTYINWLQSQSTKKFADVFEKCLKEHGAEKIDIGSRLESIQKKLRTSEFTTADLQEMLEYIRVEEEKRGD